MMDQSIANWIGVSLYPYFLAVGSPIQRPTLVGSFSRTNAIFLWLPPNEIRGMLFSLIAATCSITIIAALNDFVCPTINRVCARRQRRTVGNGNDRTHLTRFPKAPYRRVPVSSTGNRPASTFGCDADTPLLTEQACPDGNYNNNY